MAPNEAKNGSQRRRPARGTQAGKIISGPASAAHDLDATSNPTVVGVGASAGGLEALEEFFGALPGDSGAAFVVVTHQHPGHVSLLPEILRKRCQVPVEPAVDGIQLQPDRVYVVPPGVQAAIRRGRLDVKNLGTEQSRYLPIDYFLRTLAEDREDRAACIVLSGTGTDGTLGLKAVKSVGGLTMVQELRSAKYAGMPGSAIATGLADYVLPPAAMPAQLVAYLRGPFLPSRVGQQDKPIVPAEALQKIPTVLRARTRSDFSGYKPATISRRVERRMAVNQFRKPEDYIRLLEVNPGELDLLFKELLISVTSFFRDRQAWEALAGMILMAFRNDPGESRPHE